MLGTNWFKKKEKKKVVSNPIDYVITELDVKLHSYHTPLGCYASFIFIDEKPYFPRVKKTLHELNKHPDAFVLDHHYTTKEITPKTDLTGLEIIKH
jgi:hypothetical protein